MKCMVKSVDRLAAILRAKGYNSLFTINNEHPDKLDVHLKREIVRASLNPVASKLPIILETITSLPDNNHTGLIKCGFRVDYEATRGVFIMAMYIKHINVNSKTPMVKTSMDITSLLSVPTKDQANKRVRLPGKKKDKKSIKTRRL